MEWLCRLKTIYRRGRSWPMRPSFPGAVFESSHQLALRGRWEACPILWMRKPSLQGLGTSLAISVCSSCASWSRKGIPSHRTGEKLRHREEDNGVPRVTKKELIEGLGLSPDSLAPISGSPAPGLYLLGPAKPQGRHPALEWCSPRPASPLLPGKHCPYPLPDSLVAQRVDGSQAWQPLVGIQVELLFPAPSLARSMASSSQYVLPDRPQLLAGGALGGPRELGANWAQPT